MPNPLSRALSIIRAQPRPVAFLYATALMRLGLSRRFTIQRTNYKLRFYPSALSRALWLDPAARDADEHLLLDYLRPGDHVIDAGANIGSLAIPAAQRVGAQGVVHAIEAHPRTASYLIGNIALNKLENIQIHTCALGDHEGTITFSNRRSDDQNAINPAAGAAGLEVPLKPLDQLLHSEISFGAPLALFKIDVEGYELPVFRGATQLLAITQAVYFEAGPAMYASFGYSAQDVFDFLRTAGFEIFQPDPFGKKLEPVPAPPTSGIVNLLALRSPEQFAARTGYQIKA